MDCCNRSSMSPMKLEVADAGRLALRGADRQPGGEPGAFGVGVERAAIDLDDLDAPGPADPDEVPEAVDFDGRVGMGGRGESMVEDLDVGQVARIGHDLESQVKPVGQAKSE